MDPTDAKRRDRRILGCLGACALVPVLALTLWLWSTRQLPFDAAAWRAGDASARGRMARDLVDSRVLVGLTHEEVLALLGPPEPDGRYDMVYEWEPRGAPLVYTQKVGVRLQDGRVVDAFTYD